MAINSHNEMNAFCPIGIQDQWFQVFYVPLVCRTSIHWPERDNDFSWPRLIAIHSSVKYGHVTTELGHWRISQINKSELWSMNLHSEKSVNKY